MRTEPTIAAAQHTVIARPSAPLWPSVTRIRTPARRTVLLPALSTLLLGLWGIRRQGSLWQDEAVTYDMAHRPLAVLWATLRHADAVHGLYYLLMSAVFRFWEGGLVALRLPSVLAMVCATAGVAALGQRLAGPRAGLAAGMVFALLPAVQRYAQEGRSYALVTLLVVTATRVLLRACAERRRGWWLGYAALGGLAGLVHEFALLALVAHGVTLLAVRSPRATVAAWAAAFCCAATVTAPVVALSLRQTPQVAWIEVSTGGDVLGFILITGVGAGCAALRGRSPGPRAPGLDALAVPLLVVPPALLLLASTVKPLYVDRYVLYAQTGLALLAGAAFEALWRSRRARVSLVIVAVTGASIALGPVGTRLRAPDSRTDDVLAVGRALRATAEPGDGVLFLPSSRRVWTFGPQRGAFGRPDLSLAVPPRVSGTLYGTELPPGSIRSHMVSVSRIVVVRERARERTETNVRERAKEAALREYFTRCHSVIVGPAGIEVYVRGGHC
ncbi:glycosyltransferase family 39 protein [Streptomyces sp. NPDC090493]|uniref:glycosyltransferase family 39 protein n=1 Tax=Streptomyces sp. NPDC090493 TaxID=3365964 RepID=UPI003829F882